MENPVTYKGSLEWLWGGEGGGLFSGKHDLSLSATPRLAVSNKDTHVVLGIHLYEERYTRISHRDIQFHNHKFLCRSVGHVRRQTRI